MIVKEFTSEELKEVIRAARVFNPGFSEEQFQSLVELERHAGDPSYLETVKGLQRLEKETGIPLSQALETHNRLLRENEGLGQKVAAHNAKLEALKGHLRATEEKHREVIKAIQDATTQLDELRREQAGEEKGLAAFTKKAAREKQRINEELAEYRHKADVTEAEIATAGQIKAEVTKHGFSLELALGMAAEFAGYTNARERLAEALKRYGKLTSYLAALEAEIKTLSENRHHMEGILSRLGEERNQHEMVLSQLKAEIAEKGELVGFYHRYIHLRPLIDYLGSSDYLTFHHCVWCGALFWVLRPGNVATGIYKCPWCGLALVEADKSAYTAVAQPPGTPLKLLP
jgi:predicted nuclease with TOPRIM domain